MAACRKVREALVHNGVQFAEAEGFLFRCTENTTGTRQHTQESSPGIRLMGVMHTRIGNSSRVHRHWSVRVVFTAQCSLAQ